jgi:hypothetical protein
VKIAAENVRDFVIIAAMIVKILQIGVLARLVFTQDEY